MRKKIFITLVALFLIIVYHSPISNSNTVSFNTDSESKIQVNTIKKLKLKLVNSDIQKVLDITSWDIEIATYFVKEAKLRNISIFDEALPIVFVESAYQFDVINNNKNGTSDYGLFQINSINYNYLIDKLKEEQYIFDSWDMLNPYLNITAGIYHIAYLKNKYNLEGHKLFTFYNYGVTGARRYASRRGTYETEYSKRVKTIKKELTNY